MLITSQAKIWQLVYNVGYVNLEIFFSNKINQNKSAFFAFKNSQDSSKGHLNKM